MDIEEDTMDTLIREYLKEHLRVELVLAPDSDFEYDITVKLILEDEIISEDFGDWG